jgi:hypothetical protein
MCIIFAHILQKGDSMAVYVDSEEIQWRGRAWCHLVADSLAELHSFAARLGLQRRWFQERSFYPHYDVTVPVRNQALRMGAVDADRETIIACCKVMRSEMLQLRSAQVLAVSALA